MSLYGSPSWKSRSAIRTVSDRAPLGQSNVWAERNLSTARGQLTTPDLIRQFVKAGRATLTIESVATGARFTYRIKSDKRKTPGLLFVSVLTGADNSNSYTYLGWIRFDTYHHGKTRTKIGADAPSARAFDWFHRAIHQPVLPASLRVWHEGKCGRCAKKLTVPSSIETGFGPDCAEILGISCIAIAA